MLIGLITSVLFFFIWILDLVEAPVFAGLCDSLVYIVMGFTTNGMKGESIN